MSSEYVILVDDREKQPLPFPSHLVLHTGVCRLRTVRRRLPFGDYLLEEEPPQCIIERKGSLREIHQNLMNGPRRQRFRAELAYFRDHVPYPVLLFEEDPHALLTSTVPGYTVSPSAVLHDLLSLLVEYRVTPLFVRGEAVSHRRSVAELAALLLIEAQRQRRSPSCLPSAPPPSFPPPEPPTSTSPSRHTPAAGSLS